MLPDGSLLKSFSKMYRERARKPISTNSFLLARGFILGKLFQQGTIAKHCVRKIKSVIDEILRRNFCFYLTRSQNNIFVIVQTNVFGIDGGRLVLGLFHI